MWWFPGSVQWAEREQEEESLVENALWMEDCMNTGPDAAVCGIPT